MSSIRTCTQCEVTFSPTPGSKGQHCSPDCTIEHQTILKRQKGAAQRAAREQEYLKQPALCAQCKNVLPYGKRKNKFCSSSCAATFNNSGKVKSSKTRFKIAQKSAAQKGVVLTKTEGEYTIKNCRYCDKPITRIGRVYCNNTCAVNHKLSKRKLRVCTICKAEFQSSTSRHLCNAHAQMFVISKRVPYEFKFNVFDYPQLFDTNLIKQVGFKSRLNPNGLVRDHKVSIHDAIKHEYDPYYISHVMNCQLITSRENLVKNSKSSISYTQLKQLVDDWDTHHLIR